MQTHGKIKKQAVQSIFHCLAPLVFILDFPDKFSFHALLWLLVHRFQNNYTTHLSADLITQV